MTHLEFQDRLKQLSMTPREFALLSGFEWLPVKHMFHGEQRISKRIVAFLAIYESWAHHYRLWQDGQAAPDLVVEIMEAGVHNKPVSLAINLRAPMTEIDKAIGIARSNMEDRIEKQKQFQEARGRATRRFQGKASRNPLYSRIGAMDGRDPAEERSDADERDQADT